MKSINDLDSKNLWRLKIKWIRMIFDEMGCLFTGQRITYQAIIYDDHISSFLITDYIFDIQFEAGTASILLLFLDVKYLWNSYFWNIC